MGKKYIMYGIGTSTCIDLDDKTKVLAFGKMQDLTISMTAESEEIHGGDDPYPITEFPKTRSITATGKDAMFDIDLFNFSQGAETVEKETVDMLEQINFTVDNEGKLTLKHTPKEGTLVISGFVNQKEAGEEDTDTKLQYTVAENVVTFDKSVANQNVIGYYYRTSNSKKKASVTTGYKFKFPKPFQFIHRVPVYNTDTQIVGQAQLIIYKAKSDNNLELGFAPQTALAPQITIKALDPNRSDEALWSYTMEEVDPEDGTGAAFAM